MQIHFKEHESEPHEVTVYLSEDVLTKTNEIFAEDGGLSGFSQERQRDFYNKLRLHTTERVRRYYPTEPIVYDSDDLGQELVELFVPSPKSDVFDPAQHAIDVIFRALDPLGTKAVEAFTQYPTADTQALSESAFATARHIVTFALRPQDS